jgi:hypothetical protein
MADHICKQNGCWLRDEPWPDQSVEVRSIFCLHGDCKLLRMPLCDCLATPYPFVNPRGHTVDVSNFPSILSCALYIVIKTQNACLSLWLGIVTLSRTWQAVDSCNIITQFILSLQKLNVFGFSRLRLATTWNRLPEKCIIVCYNFVASLWNVNKSQCLKSSIFWIAVWE